jgi:hypothetical protein
MPVLGILVILGFSAASTAFANEDRFTIFEVRKKLQMANDEPVLKDYYISAGAEAGLKPQMIIDVKRRIPVHDGFKNQSRGDLVITVGKVQVIHVEQGLAVARLFSETSPGQRPITGFETVMIGDFLDISTAAMMVPKAKRKSAAVEGGTPVDGTVDQKAEAVEEKKSSAPAVLKPTHALAPILEAPRLPIPMIVN